MGHADLLHVLLHFLHPNSKTMERPRKLPCLSLDWSNTFWPQARSRGLIHIVLVLLLLDILFQPFLNLKSQIGNIVYPNSKTMERPRRLLCLSSNWSNNFWLRACYGGHRRLFVLCLVLVSLVLPFSNYTRIPKWWNDNIDYRVCLQIEEILFDRELDLAVL